MCRFFQQLTEEMKDQMIRYRKTLDVSCVICITCAGADLLPANRTGINVPAEDPTYADTTRYALHPSASPS